MILSCPCPRMGCVSWELRSATLSTLWISWLRSLRNTSCSFRESPQWRTFKRRGCCCCSVEQICHCLSRRGTMTEFGIASRASSTCQRSCHTPGPLLSKGGLGLCCAVRARHAAHYASWADSLPMVRQRQPCASGLSGIVRGTSLQQGSSPDLGRTSLREHDLGILPKMSRRSWQKEAASQVEQQHLDSTVWPTLSEERALWLSHQGPLASTVFVAIPTNRVPRFDPQPFRVLMTRRLRLPMPLSSRSCRCGRLLDSLGHHRAGCAEAGLLGRRGFALECSAAQVCREAGGRVHERHDEGP